MANAKTGPVWVLDTASTSTNVHDAPLLIERMDFYPTDADQDCIVQDGSGHIIWSVRSKAGAPNNEVYGIESWENIGGRPFHGLRLHTLTAGVLHVKIG
jgi:hypothetical protein